MSKKIAFQIAAGLVSAGVTAVAGTPAGMGAAGVLSLVSPGYSKKQRYFSAATCFGTGIAVWFLDRWAEKEMVRIQFPVTERFEYTFKEEK